VGSYDGEEVVLLQESARGRVRKEVGASSDTVVDKIVAGLFLAKLL
jgi:hypothetical protein